jgi:N,N'-diacetylbacillosaminyl-diphospho-undecaprenol alpha-1,3-N-acetylgalactosaminyltransferase
MANKVIKEREGIKFLVAGWFDENNPTCANMDIFNSLLDEKRILYLGMISDIRELLYITDIFILPTYREGFPRSILEAMSMEVAVITTDVPGAKDTVIDNYNGLIVPHMNIDKLKMAFETLLINKDLRAKFGQNGRMLIEKKYKERLIFFHITSLYNQLLIRC